MPEPRGPFGYQSTDDITNHLMDLFIGADVPTREQVTQCVNGFLTLPIASRFQGHREQIIDELLRRLDVTINAAQILENNDAHEPWLGDVNQEDWRLWKRLRAYLQTTGGIPRQVVDELHSSTDATLSRLESPHREGAWDRRGMVVGHVQSGKTTHYTALAAKALDAGYRIVLVLAGMHNNLRVQTQGRIDRDLIGRESQPRPTDGNQWDPIGVSLLAHRRGWPEPEYIIQTSTTAVDNGDFHVQQAQSVFMQVGEGTRLVMVVKKNASVLRRLRDWFRQVSSSGVGASRRITHPLLLIDDEADQASMNTQDVDNDPSTINRLIRELLLSFDRVGFVAYTATPFANVFADASAADDDHSRYGPDLFPRSFIVSLKAPSNYIGPDKVFGSPGDDPEGLEERHPLPMHLTVDDANEWLPPKHNKTHQPGPLPATLRQAIRLFLLNCATRCVRGDAAVHNSMLIHGTRFVMVQERVRAQVFEELAAFCANFRNAGESTRQQLVSSLRELWDREIVGKHREFRNRLGTLVDDLPAWDDVLLRLSQVCESGRVAVMAINGTSDDALAYENHKNTGFWVIAIGGDKLSRGLTLEGLSVSYFLRTSRAFDTLMQMGRWFGFRPRYADLCRVYTSRDLADGFRQIALATEELRRDFDRMAVTGREPKDFGLRVRTPSDGLLITAANKIRRGLPIQVRFDGELIQALRIPKVGHRAAKNRSLLAEFLGDLGVASRTVRGKQTPWYLWHGTPADKVLAYLEQYEASRSQAFVNGSDRLREYIRGQVEDADELTEWTVCLQSLRRKDGRVLIAGHDVAPLSRKRTIGDCPADEYDMGAVAWTLEEAADLTEEEFRRLGSAPDRADIRAARPSRRGLLLLYPISPPDHGVDDYLVSTVVSLPRSPNARTLTYTVNEVWRRQEFAFLDGDENAVT